MAAIDDFNMARSAKFTSRLQVLGAQYAQKVLDGEVTAPDQVTFARLFLGDPGHYVGTLAIGMVSDPALTGTYNGTDDSSATDATIAGVVPYAFGKFKTVV